MIPLRSGPTGCRPGSASAGWDGSTWRTRPAGRPVALKVVRSDLSHDQDFRVRFSQEIQAAQRVRGLYTAELIDADPAATPPWLVTAYVPGPSLEDVIDSSGPMPEAMVFRLIAGVAEALQAIHAAGVIHRDLKPSNVLLAPDGPRVIDFGIARALAAMPLTRSDTMMGSPDFLSPEQILDRPITPAIDVFALGSLAAFAATGRLPFGQGHMTEVAHRVVHEPPDLAGCPVRLLTLIESCLEKQAEARPAPGRVLEFCLARAAELADPSPPRSQTRPGQPGGAPAPSTRGGDRSAGRRAAGPRPAAGRPRGGSAARAARRLPLAAAPGRRHPGRGGHRDRDDEPPGTARPPGGAKAARQSPRRRRRRRPRQPAAAKPQRPFPAARWSCCLRGTRSPRRRCRATTWAAANAVDGNLGTRWSSAWSDPQWLEVDLGATHTVTKVVLDWERAYATAFQIQVSDNGTTWTDIYSTTTGAGGAQTPAGAAAPAVTSGCTAPSGPRSTGTRCGNSRSSAADHGWRVTRRTG